MGRHIMPLNYNLPPNGVVVGNHHHFNKGGQVYVPNAPVVLTKDGKQVVAPAPYYHWAHHPHLKPVIHKINGQDVIVGHAPTVHNAYPGGKVIMQHGHGKVNKVEGPYGSSYWRYEDKVEYKPEHVSEEVDWDDAAKNKDKTGLTADQLAKELKNKERHNKTLDPFEYHPEIKGVRKYNPAYQNKYIF